MASAEVLHRLPAGQRAQLIEVCSSRSRGPIPDRCGRTAAVPSRLPCGRRTPGLPGSAVMTAASRSTSVRSLQRQLADDAAAPEPAVGIGGPLPEQSVRAAARWASSSRADPVRDPVDVVPPGPGDDHLPAQRQHLQPPDRQPQAGEFGCGITLLAELGGSPQLRRARDEIVDIRRWELGGRCPWRSAGSPAAGRRGRASSISCRPASAAPARDRRPGSARPGSLGQARPRRPAGAVTVSDGSSAGDADPGPEQAGDEGQVASRGRIPSCVDST